MGNEIDFKKGYQKSTDLGPYKEAEGFNNF
jgi:hypothetical protein